MNLSVANSDNSEGKQMSRWLNSKNVFVFFITVIIINGVNTIYCIEVHTNGVVTTKNYMGFTLLA